MKMKNRKYMKKKINKVIDQHVDKYICVHIYTHIHTHIHRTFINIPRYTARGRPRSASADGTPGTAVQGRRFCGCWGAEGSSCEYLRWLGRWCEGIIEVYRA